MDKTIQIKDKFVISIHQIPLTCFYFAIGIWFFLCVVSESVLSELNCVDFFIKIAKMIVFLLLMYKLIKQKYTKQEIIKIAFLSGVTLISVFLCKMSILLWGVLFIISAKNVDMQKVAMIVLKVELITVMIVVVLALLGVVQNDTNIVYELYGLSTTNVSLYGFLHHNFIGGRIFVCYLCYVFVRFKKLNIRDYLVGIGAFFIEFFVLISKTSAVLVVACMLVVFTLKTLSNIKNSQQRMIVFTAIVFIMFFSVFFSIILSSKYDSGNVLHLKLNNLITIRFSSAHNLLMKYGISLLGQNIELISSLEAEQRGVTAVILDNAYMHLAIRCGIALMILILWGYFFSVKESIKKCDYKIAVVTAIVFLCGISEKWLFMISYNPFFLLTSYAIYGYPETFQNKKSIKIC